MTKQIKLTQGQVALVDDWWFDYLNQWKWQAKWDKTTKSFYAWRHEAKNTVRTYIYMSRVVAKTPKELIADHINHNTLDNTENNLRNVTYSQSSMNRRVYSNNEFGEKNISRHSDGKGFNVRVAANGKRWTKYCLSFEDAVSYRDKLVNELHGEFGANK